jgi:hypothetical protein
MHAGFFLPFLQCILPNDSLTFGAKQGIFKQRNSALSTAAHNEILVIAPHVPALSPSN